jgi:hypothetical protein
LIGPTPTQGEPKYVGWGTGGGTSAVGDTTLFAEKALDLTSTTGTRNTASLSQLTTAQTNDTFQAVATLIASGTGTVTNAGLFDGPTIGSNVLYVKGDFTVPGGALNVGDALILTFQVQFS